MFKSISKYSWFSFIPFTFIGLITIALLVVGVIPASYLWGTLVMWSLVSGLGVAVGYHRVFSHRTHSLPPWKENIIMFFASLAGQGSSISWTALHRGLHHPYSDTPRDIHSPVAYSAWNAFIGWSFAITQERSPVNLKHAIELLRKKNHLWFHQHQMKILWWTPLAVACIDWRASLTWFGLVTFISLMQDNLVNVVGHRRALIGYRPFNTRDNSQNNLILGWFAWGQGFHNNHHHDPKPFNLGSGISGLWWEFDPCMIFLPFLGKPSDASDSKKTQHV